MREDAEFEEVTTAMRTRVLDACDPGIEGLSGPDHILAMGAVFGDLVRMNISFLAAHDQRAFARQVLEAMEADLIELRKENGWLDG